MPESRSLDSAPWQVVFTGAALLVGAGSYFTTAVNFLFDLSSLTDIRENLASYQAMSSRMASMEVIDIYQWLAFSAQVFAVLGVVFLVLALLLWRGVLRPGIRLTASLFAWISLIGSIVLLASPETNSAGTGNALDVLLFVVYLLASLGCLSLWFGAPKRWVAA